MSKNISIRISEEHKEILEIIQEKEETKNRSKTVEFLIDFYNARNKITASLEEAETTEKIPFCFETEEWKEPETELDTWEETMKTFDNFFLKFNIV